MKKLIFILLLLCASAQAQTVTSLCGPICQLFDNSGNLLSGGKLYSYQAGTTTLQPTYTDSTGLIQNANPIILNAAGMPSNINGTVGIFLTTAAYKFCAQNSLGVQQWCQDGITLFNSNALLKNVDANCTSPGPAVAGFIRLCNGDIINWRNIANNADIGFKNAGAAVAGTGNIADVLQYGSSSKGAFQAQRYLDFSTAPAQSGVIGAGNNVCLVAARTADGLNDVCAVQVNGSNVTVIGGSAGVSVNGTSVTLPAITTSGEISLQGSDSITADPLGNGGSTGWKYQLSGSGSTGIAVGIAAGTEVHKLGSSSWLSIFGTTEPANNASGTVPDTNSVMSLGANGQIRNKRTLCSNATHYSGADGAITISGGWGVGSAVSAANGCDEHLSFTVTAAGTPAANPTITITFKDGAFPTNFPISICSRNDTSSPAPSAALLTWVDTTTTLTLTFNGTPSAGVAYAFFCHTGGI